MSKRKNNFKRQPTKEKKGFTLIELLATIFIISLVFGTAGYYIFNIINASKEKGKYLTQANIKTSARIYVEENPDEIVWKVKAGDKNSNTKYSCISIRSLINKNYLKTSLLENSETLTIKDNKQIEYVIVKKNTSNNTIISEELDTTNTCQPLKTKVVIPTSKEYCTNPTYKDRKSQSITKTLTPEEAKNFKLQNNIQSNAGTYKITISLNDKNKTIWSDGTNNDKSITCSIQKAIPTLSLEPAGGNETINETTLKIAEAVSGTITLKSSNKDYVTATASNTKITNGGSQKIQLNYLSTRQTETYITVTFTPTGEDSKNYYSSSAIFTVGEITPQKVDIPTKAYCITGLKYNQTNQKLVKNPSEGYDFLNIYGMDAGTYTITARLKYGYVWKDQSFTNKTFQCQIAKTLPLFAIDETSGTIMKNNEKSVVVRNDIPGYISAKSSNEQYIKVVSTNPLNVSANSSSTIRILGVNVTSTTPRITFTFTPSDIKNYLSISLTYDLKVTTNEFTLTYDANGGNTCSPKSKKVTYAQKYGTLCTPTRTGYTFAGWYTDKTNGTSINSETIMNTAKDHTIYAHWTVNNIYVQYDMNGGTWAKSTNTNLSYSGSLITKGGNTKVNTYSYGQTGIDLPNWDNPDWINISKTGYHAKDGAEWKLANGNSFPDSGTVVSANNLCNASNGDCTTTLYVNWVPNTYQVTYNSNGGNACSPTSKSVTYASTYGTLCKPTRTGYTFAGWFTTASGGTQISDTTKVTITANQTLYAHWTVNTYKVTYNTNGGNACNPISKSVTYASTYGTLCTPTRTGYTFVGWFTTASGGTQISDTTKVTITANQTLYAHWTANKYTVNYNCGTGSGTAPTSQTATYDQNFKVASNTCSKSGYTFAGWSDPTGNTSWTNWSGTWKYTNGQYGITNNTLTLTAQWTTSKYTVNYSCGTESGTAPASQTAIYDQNFTVADNTCSKTGYTFAGWSDPTGNTSWTNWSGTWKYTNGQYGITNSTLTLTANWKINNIYVQYDMNGGTWATSSNTKLSYSGSLITKNGNTKVNTYTYGQTGIDLPNWDNSKSINISRTGYQAKNGAEWKLKNGTTFPDTGAVVEANSLCNASNGDCTATLYVNWEANTYKVTYNANGGNACSPTSKSVTYASTYGTLCKPTRTGYTFAGWYTAASGGSKISATTKVTITSNQTLYAHWTANTYKVTYDANGGNACTPTSKSVTYASTYGTLCKPTRTGYTFAGWYTATSGGSKISATTKVTITSNQTLYAHWKINTVVTILNKDYYVCPNDQNVPSRDQCAGGDFNTMYVTGTTINGTTVTVNIRLHMNVTAVSWQAGEERTLCLANTNKICVITLRTFSIGEANWTWPGADPINETFTFDVKNLPAGNYKLIVDGNSEKYRFRESVWVLDTINIKK